MPYKFKRIRRKHDFTMRTPEVRAANREIKREKYNRLRLAFIEGRGGKCERCGYMDYRALQIDHINGNGHEERKRRGPAIVFYDVWKPGASEKYQVLCANCNQIKRHERQEFGSGAPRRGD